MLTKPHQCPAVGRRLPTPLRVVRCPNCGASLALDRSSRIPAHVVSKEK